MGCASCSWYLIPTIFNPEPSLALFSAWEVRTGWRCAPKGRFKPSDNRIVPDSCPIEANFAARRGLCSAEKRVEPGSPSSRRKIWPSEWETLAKNPYP